MPLSMTPQRFEEIRRLVEDRKIAREAAEIDAATDWNKQPTFSEVDAFMAYLDNLPAPTDRQQRSRPKRR